MLFNRLSTYFYVRSSKTTGKKGTLYLRVTVNKRLLAVSSIPNIRLFESEFDVSLQKPTAECESGLICVMFMNRVNERLNIMHMELEKVGGVITREAIIAALPGIYSSSIGLKEEAITVSMLFQDFIQDQKQQVGKFISRSTYQARVRYQTLFNKLLVKTKLYTKPVINFDEEDIRQIQLSFLETHARGTVARSMFVLSSVFEFAIRKGLIVKNPCKTVKKVKFDEPDVTSLDPDELEKLTWLHLEGSEKEYRDAFVFCCWTGLSIGDYRLLNPKTSKEQIDAAQSPRAIEAAKILKTKDGLLLCGKRKKTGTEYKVPLKLGAQKIMMEYGGLEYLPQHLPASGTVLNMLMKMIGVDKKIRFHTARKTFANYLINEQMVQPIYAIKMMGWKKIEEADPYVKIKESSLHRALSAVAANQHQS